ncbi:MAG: SET domain-containing protein-lysine N-methyltransferase [Methanothrix sp.]|nr:MAG: SET domain-containing protein-lysine N-methyltransferase [Methanothrix sp.]
MYLVKVLNKDSEIEGCGSFAAELIPKGTIVFYFGKDEKYISKEEFASFTSEAKERLYKFGVEDEWSNWVIAKGDVNHSCDANILSLFVNGIYCEIAVRDIQKGEELTIDYGLLYSSFPWSMRCNCGSSHCRGTVGSGWPVSAQVQDQWNSRINAAAKEIFTVPQPLFSCREEKAKELARAVKSKKDPCVFPFIKFSLISK